MLTVRWICGVFVWVARAGCNSSLQRVGIVVSNTLALPRGSSVSVNLFLFHAFDDIY